MLLSVFTIQTASCVFVVVAAAAAVVVVVIFVVRHTTFVVIMCKHCSVCYCQFSQYKQPGVLLLLSGTTFDNICCHYV